jgi:hypothetical protein
LNTLSFLTVILAFPNLYMGEMVFAGLVILLMHFACDVASLKLAIGNTRSILGRISARSQPIAPFSFPNPRRH